MNWRECVYIQEALGVGDRFTWPAHASLLNCEPGLTISDLTGAVMWIVTAPGDWILRLEPIRTLFEIDTPATGHWASLILAPVLLFVVLPLFVYVGSLAIFAPLYGLVTLIERIFQRRPKG